MGEVHGLWELLPPVGRRVLVETLAGKRLAVDASIWMVQFMRAMRDESGEMVRDAHLLGFLRRICKLLFLRVRPVFVFDGATPVLKRRALAARHRHRDAAQTKVRKTADKLSLRFADHIRREIGTLKLLKHPNVVRLHEVLAKIESALPLEAGIDGLDGGSPLLFYHQGQVKSTREIIQDSLGEAMHGEGDLLMHLTTMGYKLNYQQTALSEYDFTIRSLFEDVQDGMILCRVVHMQEQRMSENKSHMGLISNWVQVPAETRMEMAVYATDEEISLMKEANGKWENSGNFSCLRHSGYHD